jgi:hypothetical protein
MGPSINENFLRQESIEKEVTDVTTYDYYCTLRDGSLFSSESLSSFSEEEEYN